MEGKEELLRSPSENGSPDKYHKQINFSDDNVKESARKHLKRKHLAVANADGALPRIPSVLESGLSEVVSKRIKKAKKKKTKKKKKRLSSEAASDFDSDISRCSTSSKKGHKKKKRNHPNEADDAEPSSKPISSLIESNTTKTATVSTPHRKWIIPPTSSSATASCTMTPTNRVIEPVYAPVVDDKTPVANLVNDYRRFGGGSEAWTPVRRVICDSVVHLPRRFSFGSVGTTQAKRLKTADGRFITCFFTKVYVFSNHFSRPALFEVDGVKYLCSEQYYMYYKARVFGDMDTARLIMNATTPREIKRIGTRVRNFDLEKWRKVAIQVMVIASLAKYEQNADLRSQLFATAGSTLVETNPDDRYWGVGLFMHDPAVRQPMLWPGQNVLGRLLTMLRERLMARDEFRAEATAQQSPPTLTRLDGAYVKQQNVEKREVDTTITQTPLPHMQQPTCQRNQLDLTTTKLMKSLKSKVDALLVKRRLVDERKRNEKTTAEL